MWTDHARNFFFHEGPTEEEQDEHFKSIYCSARTINHVKKNQINWTSFRRIVSYMSRLAPDLEHSTSGWSIKNAKRLLVVFGVSSAYRKKGETKLRVERPRFGLYGENGKVYIWVDRSFVFPEKSNFSWAKENEWSVWPGDDEKIYYSKPLAQGSETADLDAFFAVGTSPFSFFQDINEAILENRKKSFVRDEVFSRIRLIHGIPEEFNVIYPKIRDEVDAKKKKEEKERAAVTKNSRGAPQTTADSPQPGVEAPDPEPDRTVPDGDSLPALSSVSAAVIESADLQNDPQKFSLTDSASVVGRYYVYALVDPRNKNKTPFYIGKGFHNRALQHFQVVDINDSESSKTNHDEELECTTLGIPSEAVLELEVKGVESKRSRIKEILDSGVDKKDVVRVIARGVSERAAFAIEAMTIKSIYGRANLLNEVPGHHDERFREVGKWKYERDYDLRFDERGEFMADDGSHQNGKFYIYVLRDPMNGEIFYVGKGVGARLCQHFKEARAANETCRIERLNRLRRLLREFKPKDIGRVVARVDNEALAYALESFYMKFAVDFRSLANVQPGHLLGCFRSRGDWSMRQGFDLPIEMGGMYQSLKDVFLGEGLDTELYDVVDELTKTSPDSLESIYPPDLRGAGELAITAKINGVDECIRIQIHVRCARRFQVFLMPQGKRGKSWVKEKFGRFKLYPVHRRDDRFSPLCWKGSSNLSADPKIACERALRLIQLAQVLQRSENYNDLRGFQDLLDGLPNRSHGN